MARKNLGVDGLVPSPTPYFSDSGKAADPVHAREVVATPEDPTACKKCGQKMLVRGTRITHRWYRCENRECEEFEKTIRVARPEASRMLAAKQKRILDSQQGKIREEYSKHAAREDM